MTRHGIPVLLSSTLALLLGSTAAPAGSWFGPGPYGAAYHSAHSPGVGIGGGDLGPPGPGGPPGPPAIPGLYGGRCPFIWDWTFYGYYPYYYSEPSNYILTSPGPLPVFTPPGLLMPPGGLLPPPGLMGTTPDLHKPEKVAVPPKTKK